MRSKITKLLCLLMLASVTSAQNPIPEGLPRCSGMIKNESTPHTPFQPRSQVSNKISTKKNLCSHYTFGGWRETTSFHLGEGAHEWKDKIEMAVDTWNESLLGFNQEAVIEITSRRPKNFFLQEDFWNSDRKLAEQLSNDGQSVIYLKGGASDDSNAPGGFAYPRWDQNGNLVEVDIYINMTYVEKYGPYLAEGYEVMDLPGEKGLYVYVNSTYLTILHEIGHALGLEHVPVSGNIMSYNPMPQVKQTWKSAFIFGAISSTDYQDLGIEKFDSFAYKYTYYTPDQELGIRVMQLFTESFGLGEQDKLSLLCAYEFNDWNDY